MNPLPSYVVRPFTPEDQPAARGLILDGLREYWGTLDEAANPDLIDIARSYGAPGYFVVAESHGSLIATGGFQPVADTSIQIHRMSVASELRGNGLGSAVLLRLLDAARVRGFHRVVLETTATWDNAIAFYKHHGFRPFELRDGDLYFERSL